VDLPFLLLWSIPVKRKEKKERKKEKETQTKLLFHALGSFLV
jgi:hypothetical protein